MSDSEIPKVTFTFVAAFNALCMALETNGVITRSQVAEAMQEQLLRASLEQGLSDELLQPLRHLAVKLAPVPGAPTA